MTDWTVQSVIFCLNVVYLSQNISIFVKFWKMVRYAQRRYKPEGSILQI